MNEINQKLLEYVEKYFPLEEFDFGNPSPTSNGYIFDSNFCRVKFELSQFNYPPFTKHLFTMADFMHQIMKNRLLGMEKNVFVGIQKFM